MSSHKGNSHQPSPSARVAHNGARASSWASVAVLYWTRGASAPSTPRWVGEGGVTRASYRAYLVSRYSGTGNAVRVRARFLARERRRERASRALYTGCAQRSALMRGRLSTAPSVSHYKGNHQHPQRVSPTTALDVSNRRHLACEAICLALSVRASYCEIIARPPLDGAHSEHSPAPSARVAHDGARASSWASVAVLYWTRGASAPSTPRWVGEGGVMRAS